jgi:hypothetical protein
VVEREGSSSSGVDAEQSRVRHRWLHQISGRARENQRGKGGSARCRVEEGKQERERAPGTAIGSADCGVRMAPGGVIGGGNVHSWRRRASEQGRAVGRAHGAARLTGGVGRQRGPVVSSGVQEEERKAR